MKKRIIILFLLILVVAATICSPAMATGTERDTEAEMLAKILYRECRGVPSKTRQAAVAWCVLNRVDHEDYPDTIYEVATQKHQFAWVEKTPVTDELYALAQDVLMRWKLEKLGVGEVGRVLPKKYIFFAGHRDGENYFRATYRGSCYYWDWSLESPYEN